MGCSSNIPIWIVSGISLLDLILSSRPSVPGRQCFSCVCSKVTFPCGTVSFTKCLTGLVDRSRFLVFLVYCNVCSGIVRLSIVGVRVCLTTIIIVVIAGTIRYNLGWVFFSFELTALVSIVIWLSAKLASWLGFFWVLLSGLLRQSIYLQFILGFQTIQF